MQEKQTKWSDIQRQMPAEDALVEIIRYRQYDLRRLETEHGLRAMFGFTDSVYYAALVTTKESTSGPLKINVSPDRTRALAFVAVLVSAVALGDKRIVIASAR